MPIVQVEIIEGRTIDQKRQMVKKVTEAMCEALGVLPEAVTIVIRDMPKSNLARAGQLRVDQES